MKLSKCLAPVAFFTPAIRVGSPMQRTSCLNMPVFCLFKNDSVFWSQIGFLVHLKGASVTLGRDLTGSSVMWRKSVSEPSA
jgi:hypothetical protein